MLRGKVATLASLLPVTSEIVVVGGGETPDPALDAVAERRTLDWFDRHALKTDAIVYVTATEPDAALAERNAVHPGISVHLDGWWLKKLAPPQIDATLVEGRDFNVLPVAVSPAEARALREELKLPALPLAVAFVSGRSAPPAVTAAVTTHEVAVDLLSLGSLYRTLITAADLLFTAGPVPPSLIAQLIADSGYHGLPLDPAAIQMPRVRPSVAEAKALVSASAALTSALATARPTMLASATSRLRLSVGGVGPVSNDLAQLATALATNAAAER